MTFVLSEQFIKHDENIEVFNSKRGWFSSHKKTGTGYRLGIVSQIS